MRKVLIVGAGKSSPFLIKYLIDNSVKENLFILIADANLQNLKKIITNKRCKTILFDINDVNQKNKLIQDADIVISLLPAHLAKRLERMKKEEYTPYDMVLEYLL